MKEVLNPSNLRVDDSYNRLNLTTESQSDSKGHRLHLHHLVRMFPVHQLHRKGLSLSLYDTSSGCYRFQLTHIQPVAKINQCLFVICVYLELWAA